MSISQPSREVYVVDVPEIKTFTAVFRYNFFVPDESVNETGGVPANILARPGAEIDTNFIQYSTTRAPRFVEFQWDKPKLADVGNLLSEQASRDHAFKTTGEQNGSLILNNIDKVVNEDDFASNNYASVHFHDGEIDNKIHQLVSGTMITQTLQEESDPNTSPYKAAQRLLPLLPAYIKPHFVTRAMTLPAQSFNGSFYLAPGNSAARGTKPGLLPARGASTKVLSNYFSRLRNVTTNTQINVKLMQDLVSRTIQDPTATNASDLTNMHQYAKQVKQATNQRFTPAVSENDFKTFVPFINVRQHADAGHIEKYGAEIVGYIIDKFEILAGGTLKAHPPIVIESANVSVGADFQVKHTTGQEYASGGQQGNYCYSIRTIALLTTPAIDDDTGNVATVKILISSKPSNKVYVSTSHLEPPPPPGDIDFIWNYETNKLTVTWAFPITSERDVKQFQIFKRERVEHPFELQKVYNFDDNQTPWPSGETPDAALVERLTSPAQYWVDDEFDPDERHTQEKGLIYTVACIDAHGLTSNYGAQFRVWFDRFANALQRELVSHLGAPKPYPNMYLEGNLLANTIRASGPHTKRMRLFFNPEFYYLTDDNNRVTKVLQTKQAGGGYKLQFINLDSLKAADIDITIDDKTLQSSRALAYPSVRFGPKRRTQQKPT